MPALGGLFSGLTSRSADRSWRRIERELAAQNYSLAASLLRTLADAENPAACFRLAECYERGQGVVQNFAEATRWFEKAAASGATAAKARLGEIYLVGYGAPDKRSGDDQQDGRARDGALQRLFPRYVPPNLAAALRWNELAATDGDADAKARLGYQYGAGLGVPADRAASERWFLQAASQDSEAGILGLGMLYAGGFGGTVEATKAEPWLLKAAAKGRSTAKLYLGVLHLFGEGLELAPERAAALLTEAAEDHPDAMFHLGRIYREGKGVAADASQAETWLRRATARGHPHAMLELGRLFASHASSPDYTSATILFREAADLGHAEAQFALGHCYLFGRGVPKDYAEAAKWLQKAAEDGVPAAAEALGILYARGLGVSADQSTAIHWFSRAAASGSPGALFELGMAHLTSKGETDAVTGIALLRRAAEAGSADACLQLGTLYSHGDRVDQDYAAAARWYEKAGQSSQPDGFYHLAFLRLQGLGCPRDIGKGMQTLEQAADRGSRAAMLALHDLHTDGVYFPADRAVAQKWLLKAAGLGDGGAARLLLVQVVAGTASTQLAGQVVGWLKNAAERGDPKAEAELGRLCSEGRHVAKDDEAATAWFTRAARGGDAFAQAWLGDLLWREGAVDADKQAALAWYRKAGAAGHLGALIVLTQRAFTAATTEVEWTELFALWLDKAKAGIAVAQRMVGYFYLQGRGGVAESVSEARRWLRLAAERGDEAAEIELASLVLREDSDGEEIAQAIAVLQKAAQREVADAEYALGVCHRLGVGVEKDPDAVERLYRRAATKGHASAQIALAERLLKGGAWGAAVAEAVTLLRSAAEKGAPRAYFWLGRLHELGRGVPRSRERAIDCYARAEAAGFAEAGKFRKRAARAGSQAQQAGAL